MLSAKKELFTPSGGGYQISRSVRFRSSSSAYFTRTPSVAGNRRTFTISAWVKKGRVDDTAAGVQASSLFGAGNTGNVAGFKFAMGDIVQGTNTQIFSSQETIHNVSNQFVWYGTERYRDPSAWYHIVVAFDTPQATASNRLKIWVNGQQIGAGNYTASLAQNQDLSWNNNVPQFIGASTTNAAPWLTYFDGLLAEVYSVDGQALTPSSFGETNAVTGVWQPKEYAGTYGTNGFYLNFSDNSGVTATTIGKDYSGNGNNWTPSAGISITAGATYDSMLDVPTPYADGGNGRGNYATLNAVDLGYSATLSEANLKVSTASSGNAAASSTMAMTGNTYWEVTIGSNSQVGLIWGRASDAYGNSSISMFASGVTGSLGNATRTLSATPSWSNGDTLGLAWNSSTRVLTLYQAGSATAVMTMLTPATGDPQAVVTNYTSGSAMSSQVNFGQRPFAYTPPTGFVALNTQNLPTPTISNGASYMAATTYTGDGATTKTIATAVNGVSFQPDFTWVKRRSGASSHVLQDAIRGFVGTAKLASNATDAENNTGGATGSAEGFVSAVSSTGFTVTKGTGEQVNENGATYVGWQWNAGGSTVTNTSGSISAQVRANPTAGFSVVTYTGTGANATVGHGLGVAPKMVIVKCRTGTSSDNWAVWHSSFAGGSSVIYLNLTNAVSNTATTMWNSTTPTSTVFSIGTADTNRASGYTYVAYCFAAVAGYSAFGSYTGNGSNDGPFVYLGFRPKFVFWKNTSTTSDWQMKDATRSTYNVISANLYPNLSNAENSAGDVDFLSNGFKLRSIGTDVNGSGNIIIYAAFAENPFKYSLAR